MNPKRITIYRCKECGKMSGCIGELHSHIERCIARDPLGILRNPFKIGDFDYLMGFTQVIEAEITEIKEHIDYE